MSPDACPPQDRLLALLEEGLSEEERARLEDHVGGCIGCQTALARLVAGPSPEWEELLRPDPRLSGDDPEEGFIERLKEAMRPHVGSPRPAIPGYEVLEEIGRGGSAVVYRARQSSGGRVVALKVLPATVASEERLRAIRGVEALAQVDHPNVMDIFDVGEADGWLYSAREYLGGGTLEDRMTGDPWPWPEAARLVLTLAEAVRAIHEAGFIHRDLKPANILFTSDGVPKVGDFGLARQAQGSVAITHQGDILGSPRYMAPEQALGRTNEVGPPADCWSLGVILYELLTGRPPFHGTTVLDTLARVVHEEPEPPARLVADLSGDLEAICLRCLRKGPGERYPSARELAEELAKVMTD